MRLLGIVLVFAALLASSAQADEPAKKLRVGMIGLDTSHVVAFTKAIKNPKFDELKGLDVVAAFPGGSPDIPASADRIDGFTKALKEMGVEIVDSVEALLPKVDAVMLESVDGRPHLAQAKPVIAAKKPLFIDKPMAASLADVLEIFRLAKANNVPVFSSSSLRFSPGIIGMRNDPKIGEVRGCDAYSPCSLESHHPDLFWYGVHGVEMLYTIMGSGCTTVTRATTPETDLVTGVWSDGRIGTFRGLRGKRLDLRRNHRKAFAGFTRARRLDGSVERQEVGLRGNLGDKPDHRPDPLGRLVERAHGLVGALGVGDRRTCHLKAARGLMANLVDRA